MKSSGMITKGLMLFSLVLAMACAHTQADKDLEQSLKTEPQTGTREDLNASFRRDIKANSNLTEEQRNGLLSLQQKTQNELNQLRAESFRLRELLITDVTNPNYKSDEVELIKTHLKQVENKRLNVIFDAVDEANNILGRKNLENIDALREFISEDHGR